ncbi:DUF5309 domain-containing protein [Bacillus sp. ISL-4]|uniref:SU10 major capsid protein n=1 Tax=Bacillus sp. ISL-4 TaxID=2819125 RepID=UPI001BEC3F39|nr:DUF5309 family protein [Bacillus sp. ISL-4]MBT2667327.1 DUF5309 domain-containing protein [Bacillus sp. ISL-4]MBT2669437.1 DUF5309 domain-containing protein [Streptomyces sp. ISL-14]
MLDTNKLTNLENIHLTDEIAVVAPMSTPFMTLLMSKGQYVGTGGKIHTWREKTLDFADVTVGEGSEATNFANGIRAELNNVLEIFLKSTSVSGTAQATGKVGDLFASEINDRLAEVKVAIEKRLINGIKDDGSVSGVRKMDGLLKFADASNILTGATTGQITEEEIKGLVRKLWDKGIENGEFYALVNYDIKEKVDALYKDSYHYQHVTNDFGLVVSSITTNYGKINFVLDRYVPTDKVIAFDLNSVSVAFLREPQFEALGKTGDNIKGQVVAEATLEVASKKAVAVYTLKA